ncbi:hypothetical protein COCSUDRAFT_59086 [Coccomyxa subellipsoidea C-169]|uniref:Uncharacterized protein n=1 Tax=Coccomyxa subellipsoidea (strain C-169) TaxID=574566 RepID=I0Z7E1_COCSC|nr:hypothetical protein COCSUDRAFT_59086 [Coccomyxa subellipsoidea C-169]EIE26560.1 hypothetical protein COCSUDRAFT_59086 [Coccomyxa subellipsoidea C-169]|eukprot:XP_005651104.1 hypothetical protein COCSUDRAFT_59086 [Coccomyxa subellipsoidea C-169]
MNPRAEDADGRGAEPDTDEKLGEQEQAQNDEASAFIQQMFLGTLNGLSISVEQLFLAPSAQTEQDVKALQYEADDAEQDAQQALQMAEEHLMDLACTVQQFQEQIAQVLPDVSRKRAHDQL